MGLLATREDGLEIDDDPARVDPDRTFDLVVGQGYWANDRTREEVARSIPASWCFGVYDGAAQVAFARVVTDRVDLRRVTRWPRLAEFMRDSAMRRLTLSQEPGVEGGALERLLEGSAALDQALRPQSPDASRAAARRLIKEVTPVPRVGRNDPCPCGSGKKFKKCCVDKA